MTTILASSKAVTRSGVDADSVLDHQQFAWLSVTVLAALLPHASRFPTWYLGLLLGLAALRWMQRERRPRPLSRWLILPLTLGLAVAVSLAYGSLLNRSAGTALLAGMLVLKLVEGERRRDALLAITLAWFLMMVAFLFDQRLQTTLLVIGLMPIGFAALLSLNSARVVSLPAWPLLLKQARRRLSVGALLILQALPLAVVAFVFLPRLATPLWGVPDDVLARTGLTDRMAPGSMAELLLDDTPALRVSFDGPTPSRQAMYWRALVLSEFDGEAWTRAERVAGPVTTAVTQLPEQATLYRYEVVIEPIDARWLPMLDLPVEAPEGATLDRDLQPAAARAISSVQAYPGLSSPDLRVELELNATRRAQLTALPPGFNPRSRDLAQRWRREHGEDDAALVAAALRHFRENPFSYTYLPPLLGRNSVDDFMFSTQAGFCEHYASAFAFLMRAAGIPTRVVIGYQGGFHNRAGDFWLLRNSDAHAWNEVWLPQRGWVRFDPTSYIAPERVFNEGGRAATRSSRFDGESVLSRLYQNLDRVGHLWRRAVLEFNAARQQSMMDRLGLGEYGTRALIALLALGVAVAMTLLTWMALRPAHLLPRDPVLRAWRELCRTLSRQGLPVPPWMAPRRLAQWVREAWPDRGDELAALCLRIERLRYASSEVDAAEVQALRRAIAGLRLTRLRVPPPEPRLNVDPSRHLHTPAGAVR